jgi:glycosyltransferase involved in cell wall biosynthesis
LISMDHDVVVWAADGSTPESESKVPVVRGALHEVLSRFGRPDVIHDNGMWLPHNHRVAALASSRSIPRIVSTRGMLEPWARAHKRFRKSLAWHLYQKRDLKSASVLHATSRTEEKNLRAADLGNRIAMIPNGVDVPPNVERSPGSSRRIAAFVGRLYPVKGLPMLLDAWASVRPRGWELRIAGPDEQGHRRELEETVKRLQLRDDVTFLGPVRASAKSDLLNSADLFVAPSHTESFGMAIAEAMAHGLPVLTTSSTPWPEIESEKIGWMAEPTAIAIASALSTAVVTDYAALREMGMRARQLVSERYSWHRAAMQFEQLYESVAASR